MRISTEVKLNSSYQPRPPAITGVKLSNTYEGEWVSGRVVEIGHARNGRCSRERSEEHRRKNQPLVAIVVLPPPRHWLVPGGGTTRKPCYYLGHPAVPLAPGRIRQHTFYVLFFMYIYRRTALRVPGNELTWSTRVFGAYTHLSVNPGNLLVLPLAVVGQENIPFTFQRLGVVWREGRGWHFTGQRCRRSGLGWYMSHRRYGVHGAWALR